METPEEGKIREALNAHWHASAMRTQNMIFTMTKVIIRAYGNLLDTRNDDE